MGTPSNRTVVIGLELGDGHLVNAWARAGRLPALKALMEEGSWGWLGTTAEQLHISAWPCIYTGATPGEHGVYFTFQPAPGLQGYQRFHTGLYGRPTFWQLLDQAGRRCAVLDPPYSHPEEGFGGAFVYDWGTWAHYLKPGSSPPGLLRQLEQANGTYPLGMEANDLGFTPLEVVDTARRLVRSVQAKADAACWLMREHGRDLAFTVFGETHVAGHYLWTDALQDPERRMGASPMLDVYLALDRAIGQIRAAAGPEATFVVISGDCVGPNRAGWQLLPEVLTRLGFLATPQMQAAGDGAPAPARRFDPVKALRDLLPKDFRKSLARRLPTKLRDRLAQRVDTADIDWTRTRAYCLPTDLEGYIRVNFRGREPQGIVEPGAGYEGVLAELTTEIGALRDAGTGRPIVREILRADQAFPGDHAAYLPDLIVRWDASAPIVAASSARVGTVSVPSPDGRPGTHQGPGFLLACGRGIAAGAVLHDGHILDFAPTLLARMGVAVPPHMHGRVWPELTAV